MVVEKPAARSAKSCEPLAVMAREAGVVVKVGYNHRFHPAAQKARALLGRRATAANVMFLRGRYGHGGRIGYDKEWRADPEKSGGGELIDQGVHLIDLARWFLGAELTEVEGRVETYFWKMPVDDNAFLTLAAAARRVAHLQVSCTEWKNMFSLEIYARHAKLHWEGLGGSYGPERVLPLRYAPGDGAAGRRDLRVRAGGQILGAGVAGLRARGTGKEAALQATSRTRCKRSASWTACTGADGLRASATATPASRRSAFSSRNPSVSTMLSSMVRVGAHPSLEMRAISSKIFGESPGPAAIAARVLDARRDAHRLRDDTRCSLLHLDQSVCPRLKTLTGSRARSTARNIASHAVAHVQIALLL